VRLRPYNDGGIGPTSNEIIQQTPEDIPGTVNVEIDHSLNLVQNILWNTPLESNGIITTYEIQYSVTNNTYAYNTTNTHYSINDVLPNTSYTIKVRPYTSVGSGEWTVITTSITSINFISSFTINRLNATAIEAHWHTLTTIGVKYYTVYYYSTNGGMETSQSIMFTTDMFKGIITGLQPNVEYVFEISMTLTINGAMYEGERLSYTLPIVNSSSVGNQQTSSLITSNVSLIMATQSSSVLTTLGSNGITSTTCSCTVSPTSSSTDDAQTKQQIFTILIFVLSGLVLILTLIVVVETIALIFCKKCLCCKKSMANDNGIALDDNSTTYSKPIKTTSTDQDYDEPPYNSIPLDDLNVGIYYTIT
jgi:hypothetical protein